MRYNNLKGTRFSMLKSMRFLVLRKFYMLNERNAADTNKWFDEYYPSSTLGSLKITIFTSWMPKSTGICIEVTSMTIALLF